MRYEVHTTTETRERLTGHVKRFRQEGASAEPVVFGSHRRPEAVVLPFPAFEELMARLEDLEIADTVRVRLKEAGDRRLSHDEVWRSIGVDSD